jgi:hypothetical protein
VLFSFGLKNFFLGSFWEQIISKILFVAGDIFYWKHAMKRNFGSFLVKYWAVKDPEQGAECVLSIKHIQSGKEERGMKCIADLGDWMDRCLGEGPVEDPRQSQAGEGGPVGAHG